MYPATTCAYKFFSGRTIVFEHVVWTQLNEELYQRKITLIWEACIESLEKFVSN